MRKTEKNGIPLLVQQYKMMFRLPENINYYGADDYKKAERKFLKYAMQEGFGRLP